MQMKLMYLGGSEVAGIRNGLVKEQVSLLLGMLLMQCSASTGRVEDCGWILSLIHI